MLEITIPSFGELKLAHVVFDFNGTLAVRGKLISGLEPLLAAIKQQFTVHIVTGDGYGRAREELANVDCELKIIAPENQAIAKVDYISQLGTQAVIAIGNGRNDRYMVKKAAIGIAVLGDEGAASETMLAADIVTPSIFKALELLQNPRSLIATLRS